MKMKNKKICNAFFLLFIISLPRNILHSNMRSCQRTFCPKLRFDKIFIIIYKKRKKALQIFSSSFSFSFSTFKI